MMPFAAKPAQSAYDVVIIGGGIMGASTAWFLTSNPDFDGSVLVIERDPSFAFAATTHTNSCMRQQFSTELNIRISQFAADFVKNFRSYMGDDPRVPELSIRSHGYMYLADTEGFAATLRANQKIQLAAGAATQLMSPEEIAAAYPFYRVEDILLGSINLKDEGYFDGSTLDDWWRRKSREQGAEWCAGEVVAINRNRAGDRVETVMLASGAVISCGQVVNAAGTRGGHVARLAGLDLPIEPRKRYSWIFRSDQPLDRELPLTIDPTGVHFRENGGGTYLAGGHADLDPPVAPDDFEADFALFEDKIWPAIATRVPQFEAIKVQSEWVGHYDLNAFDRNAIVGPHAEVENFLFINGFSGHGLQQSPAMGRGTAEWLVYGRFRTLDLSPFRHDRIAANRSLLETAII